MQGGCRRHFQFDLEHQLRPFVDGFHIFRRELSIAGNVADSGGEHGINAVEHDARFVAQLQLRDLRRGQEDIHAGIGRVEQADDLAARRQHVADIGDFVLHAPVNRAADEHVVVGRSRFAHLRLRGADGRLRFGMRCLGGSHRRGGAVAFGAALAQLAVGNQFATAHGVCVIQLQLRHVQPLFVSFDFGIGAGSRFLHPLFLRLGRFDTAGCRIG